MSVSVIICTWNRARLLAQTLEAFDRLVVPPGCEWELLVVNNASTDDTDDVLASFANRLPLRRLFEAQPGKAHAANLALCQARHELTLWTDDDVLVDPHWLIAYWDAAEDYPEAAYFGGPVDPLFSVQPPAWISRHMDYWGVAYAMIDLGPATRRMTPRELPFGANLAFRRSALDAVGGFDPRLGPTENNQIRGEESALVSALCRAGYDGVWVGDARVQHFIPPDRLGRKFLSDYFRGLGRTEARRWGGRLPGRDWRGAPLWAVREHWWCRLESLAWRWVGSSHWAQRQRRAWITEGIIDECRRAGWRGGAPAISPATEARVTTC